MADPVVTLQVNRGVATITLDSPGNRNALSAAVRRELTEALDRASTDPAVRVVVLTHRGPVFCSGMNLKEAAGGGQGVRELPDILRLIAHCPRPVVAAVNGPARAGGIGLLAAADIVLAAPHATFAFSEVRIGLIPAVITVPVLRRVAPAAARELLLTGEVFDAARASRIGLINSVEPDLPAAVDRCVTALLAGAPGAIAGTKRVLNEGWDDSAERYAALLDISAAQFESEEAREGGAAFLGRRPASWLP